MESEELVRIMVALNLRTDHLGDILGGYGHKDVVGWIMRWQPIPEYVARLVRFFEENPQDMEYFKQFRSE